MEAEHRSLLEQQKIEQKKIIDNELRIQHAHDENNKYSVGVKAEIQKNIDYYSKPPAKKTSGSATPAK